MVVIYSDGGVKEDLAYGSFYIKSSKKHTFNFESMTSNEAEYHTFIKTLEYINHKIDEDCIILIDSQLILKQITGTWKCTNKKLKPLYLRSKYLIDKFKHDIVIGWIDNIYMKKIIGH